MRAPDRGEVLVVGLGVAGEAAARQLAARGATVTVVEDTPGPASGARARDLDATVVERPDPSTLAELVARSDLVVPSPGVPPHHPVFALAARQDVPVWSEFELAARWSSAPMVAVTGTNGKTTVTELITAMLRESGRRVEAGGNMEPPLVDVLDHDVDVLVVEASSFRLQYTVSFHPVVAVWLNLADDHLDWHPTLDAYAAAKARIWAAQTTDDVAVVNAEDPAVMAAARTAPGRVVTFGLGTGDYFVGGDDLVGPEGPILPVAELARALPHDCANALAAAAAARAAGGTSEGIRTALRRFRGLPHRIALVGEADGVRYYDDSKATDPHAARTALQGFESVVLIAGGRNKGLDLSVLAGEAGRVRAVVAIGEAADEVAGAFAGVRPVTVAGSMDDAVDAARSLARPGDAVLLSPGCASYDWYRNYGERGDDFARAVRERIGAA